MFSEKPEPTMHCFSLPLVFVCLFGWLVDFFFLVLFFCHHSVREYVRACVRACGVFIQVCVCHMGFREQLSGSSSLFPLQVGSED